MSKKESQLDQTVEALKEVLDKAKTSLEIHLKIEALLKDVPFEIKMSVLNMTTIKAIINDSEDEIEAVCLVARFNQQLMSILDKHIEEGVLSGEEDEDHGDETLQ